MTTRTFIAPNASNRAVVIPTSALTVVALKHRVRIERNCQSGKPEPVVWTLPDEAGLYLQVTGLGRGYFGMAHRRSLRQRLLGAEGSIMANLPGAKWVYTFTSTMALPFSSEQIAAAESIWLRTYGRRYVLANSPITFRGRPCPLGVDGMRIVDQLIVAVEQTIEAESLLHPAPPPGKSSSASLHQSIVEHCGAPISRTAVGQLTSVLTGEPPRSPDLDCAIGRDLGARGEGRFVRLARGVYAPLGYERTSALT